ncbi:hypothetical protein OG342_00300 [Streptomyces bobili]|uniref:hypothetical protein n=1 Tax=Streptomyces TaxID=1883 RepID=UPI00225B31C0|nr:MULTISPECIES: hypothetical protein [Streptomyces]MCX5521340.1 hypothetical protein [Streptomyces bobili]MDX3570970.1 hypothetical protein [Streptomyces sp. ID05-47C]
MLVAVLLFTAVETPLPRCFGARLDQKERNRHIRILTTGWSILLVGALMVALMAQKARTGLEMGSHFSPWYLWICATVAGVFHHRGRGRRLRGSLRGRWCGCRWP